MPRTMSMQSYLYQFRLSMVPAHVFVVALRWSSPQVAGMDNSTSGRLYSQVRDPIHAFTCLSLVPFHRFPSIFANSRCAPCLTLPYHIFISLLYLVLLKPSNLLVAACINLSSSFPSWSSTTRISFMPMDTSRKSPSMAKSTSATCPMPHPLLPSSARSTTSRPSKMRRIPT